MLDQEKLLEIINKHGENVSVSTKTIKLLNSETVEKINDLVEERFYCEDCGFLNPQCVCFD